MHLGALFARFRHTFAVAGNADWDVRGALIRQTKNGFPVP
jgi:hypothetical protein